jgi:predicted class III extradiol MEMO1 family dioxygenase
VQAAEILEDGVRLLLLADLGRPEGPMAVLSRAALALAALMDGTRDRAELVLEFSRQHGVSLEPALVSYLVEQLDEALLLDSPRYRADLAARREAYRAEPLRPMLLAPEVFPAGAGPAAEFLDRLFLAPGGPGRLPSGKASGGQPSPRQGRACKGVIAPHIDYPRGDGLYGQAYLRLAEEAMSADLYVLVGTDHRGELDQPLTLTAHDFATPFGRLQTDSELCWELAASRPWLDNELAHKDEHSLELQAVLLHHVLLHCGPGAGEERATRARVLPLLCGSLLGVEPDPGLLRARRAEVDAFVEELGSLTASRPYVVIAGADLAHLGPAFGTEPVSGEDRRLLATRDSETLALVSSGDAEALLDDALADGNARQICSVTAIYLAMRLLQGCRGELLGYRQCQVPDEPEPLSVVSIAAAAFHG